MLKRANVQKFVNEHWVIMYVLILLGIITSAVAIPFIIYFATYKEPYFISIDSDDDFERWCDIGNGTVENPYIIEGHQIIIPENWESKIGEYTSSCAPSFISIKGVTKSFVIQNNVFTMKNDCGGEDMISIYNVEVPFVIRNNQFKSTSYYKDGISLISVNATNSVIEDNEFYRTQIQVIQSRDLFISRNKFYKAGYYYNFIQESINITFQFNLFDTSDVEFQDCSRISFINNTFRFDQYGYREAFSGDNTNYSKILNNTFILAGLGFINSKYVEGNMVNGKPLGFFIDQSNFIIDNAIAYGQIILISCNYTSISHQSINNTYISIGIKNCVNITITNCTFYNNRYGAYMSRSNNTLIKNNWFELCQYGVGGYYANSLNITKNTFIDTYSDPILAWFCTSVIDEDNVFYG